MRADPGASGEAQHLEKAAGLAPDNAPPLAGPVLLDQLRAVAKERLDPLSVDGGHRGEVVIQCPQQKRAPRGQRPPDDTDAGVRAIAGRRGAEYPQHCFIAHVISSGATSARMSK